MCVQQSLNWTKGLSFSWTRSSYIIQRVGQIFSRVIFSLSWCHFLLPSCLAQYLQSFMVTPVCCAWVNKNYTMWTQGFKPKSRLHLRYVCSFCSKHLFNVHLSSEQMASRGPIRHLAPPLTSAGHLRGLSHSFVLLQWKRCCVKLGRHGWLYL